MSCGLTDLATCLPQKFIEFILNLMNRGLQPMLDWVISLLPQPVNVAYLNSIWAIIIYILSLFYALFFLFAGFNLMISGHNVVKRENAKMWLANVVLMVIAVQGSYIIYSLLIETGSLLTTGVVSMIDPNFFLMTGGSLLNMGLQFLLILFYEVILLSTVILLVLRYLFVFVGIVFFPFGLFFYFIPPLQSYGKLIINMLLVSILVPFFASLVLLAASMLTKVGFFGSIKIVVAMTAFLAVDVLIILAIIFTIFKAATSVMNSDVGKSVKGAVKYLK